MINKKSLFLLIFLIFLSTPAFSAKFPYQEDIDGTKFNFIEYLGLMDAEKDTVLVTNAGKLETTATISGDVILDTDSLAIIDSQGDEWEITSGGQGQVQITNQDTDVSITSSIDLPRSWTLKRGSDTVATFIQNQDTNVYIVNQDTGYIQENYDTNVFVTNQDTDYRQVNRDTSVELTNQDTDVTFTNKQSFLTAFDERVTARKINVFSLKPTWGLTDLRDIWESSSGGDVFDTAGSIRLHAGTNSSGTAYIQSTESGQYQAGAMGEAGIGIEMMDTPTGDAEARWGYVCKCFGEDRGNGFGYGQNDTGIFVFYKKNGDITRIYQGNWNEDTLDGSGDSNNPTGINLNTTNGQIYQIRFTWYAFGDALFYINVLDQSEGKRKNVLVHTQDFSGEFSILDPNQPITAKVDNRGTAGDTTKLKIGGRQFSIITGRQKPEQRPPNEFVARFTLNGNEDEWEPIMAVKKKDTFPSGTFRNSVRTNFVSVDVSIEDAPVQYKVTLSDTLDGQSWTDVTTWGNESSVESITQSDSFTAEQGPAFLRDIVFATSGQGNEPGSPSSTSAREVINMGQEQIFVLWARKETSTDAIISAIMQWNEQW